jgi:hypothetical protein
MSEAIMSEFHRQPEFEDQASGEKLTGVPALSQVATPFAAARNDAVAVRVRRRSKAARLNMSRDDGFHLFRVY